MKEKFLVLEITPAGTHGIFLSVDDDRNIVFEKTAKHIDLKKFFKFSRAPVRNVAQQAWEGEQLFKSRRRVIAAADSTLATTIPIPLDLPRERSNAKSKITTAELENMIAQAMQKIFNGCRGEAARRLGIHELDAVLVGAKTKYFKVDGKAVGSPVGFAPKNVTLLLELTFTRRELFEDLKQFFNAPDDFFFAEAPQAQLFSLSRVRSLPLNLLVPGEDGTSLFVLERPKDEYAVLYREKLNWPAKALIKEIAEALAVGEGTAEHLYHLYRGGEVSDDAARGFKKMLQPALDVLFGEVERANLRGPVYLDLPYPLPFDTPHRHGTAVFEEHPTHEILGKLGFSVDSKALAAGQGLASRALLYFLEAYFDKSNSQINQKLRHRLHWLTA